LATLDRYLDDSGNVSDGRPGGARGPPWGPPHLRHPPHRPGVQHSGVGVL